MMGRWADDAHKLCNVLKSFSKQNENVDLTNYSANDPSPVIGIYSIDALLYKEKSFLENSEIIEVYLNQDTDPFHFL